MIVRRRLESRSRESRASDGKTHLTFSPFYSSRHEPPPKSSPFRATDAPAGPISANRSSVSRRNVHAGTIARKVHACGVTRCDNTRQDRLALVHQGWISLQALYPRHGARRRAHREGGCAPVVTAAREWGARAREGKRAGWTAGRDGGGCDGGRGAERRWGRKRAQDISPLPLPGGRVSTAAERGVWLSGPELVRPSSGRLEALEQRISREI